MKREKEIGKVSSVFLGPDQDRGFFTFNIGIDFKGSFQHFGNYALDSYDEEAKKRMGTAEGMNAIRGLYDFFGVHDLNDAIGKYVEVDREGDSWGIIVRISRLSVDGGAVYDIKNYFPNV